MWERPKGFAEGEEFEPSRPALRDGRDALEALACSQLGGGKLAEGEGFEPPVEFPPQWFSRPPPSTTRPSLRVGTGPEFVGSLQNSAD